MVNELSYAWKLIINQNDAFIHTVGSDIAAGDGEVVGADNTLERSVSLMR